VKSVLEQRLSYKVLFDKKIFKTFVECAENIQTLNTIKRKYELCRIASKVWNW